MTARCSRQSVTAAAAAATVLFSGLLAGCEDGRTADLDQDPLVEDTADGDAAVAETVSALEQAVRRRDVPSATGLAGTGSAARELRVLATNARRLDLRDLSLRYLARSATALSTSQRERWGEQARVVDVQVAWRYGGVDRTGSVLSVPFVMRTQDGSEQILTVDLPQGDRLPLWLDEELRVARSGAAVAVTTPPHPAGQFLRYARAAVRNLERNLPWWRGVLSLEVPRDEASFRDATGVAQEQAAAIAAVTTTPDGSSDPGAPQHIYLNPRLFDPLTAEGRQIVVNHEAVHVALGAARLDLPLWLSEGVADYVALAQSDTPVTRLAAQILRLTRSEGPPTDLPGGPQFDGSDERIGAHYEGAWLAVKLVADTYGVDALWRFYRQAVRDGSTRRAFRDVLGITRSEFVRDWQAYLSALSG